MRKVTSLWRWQVGQLKKTQEPTSRRNSSDIGASAPQAGQTTVGIAHLSASPAPVRPGVKRFDEKGEKTFREEMSS